MAEVAKVVHVPPLGRYVLQKRYTGASFGLPDDSDQWEVEERFFDLVVAKRTADKRANKHPLWEFRVVDTAPSSS